MDQPDETTPSRQERPRPWILCAKIVIVALVTYGILRALRGAWEELDASPFVFRELKWRWLVSAGLLFGVAQVPMVWYWQQLLSAMQIAVPFGRCLRAFVYGHLGKYVPGKLMVVIMRSGLLRLRPQQVALAASSVFVETFTYMAAGAFAAALGIVCLYRQERTLQLLALTAMIALMLCTWPPLLRWAVSKAHALGIAGDLDVSQSIRSTLIAKGWAASLVSWLLSALSLYATMRSLPMPEPVALDATTIARLTTSLCAAVVAGFVSMVPGGLLAREFVLDRLLVPYFGEVYALFATVLLRIVWLLTELIGSTILYVAGRR